MHFDGIKSGMAKITISRKFLLYVLFSGFAALVNFASRFLYESIPEVNFEFAVALAYISGMIVNFGFSKWITFDAGSSGKFKREALKFFAVAGLGLLVTVAISAAAIRILEHTIGQNQPALPVETSQETLAAMAHLAGMAAGLVANFFGHELISFRSTGIGDKLKDLLSKHRRD